MIDCLVLIARRLKLGRSPFNADRDHLHHLLLDAGFKPTQVAVGLALLSLLMGFIAALILRTNLGNETHLVIGFIALAVGYYWLTSRRPRAVQTFRRLRFAIARNRAPSLREHARRSEFPRRAHPARRKKPQILEEEVQHDAR